MEKLSAAIQKEMNGDPFKASGNMETTKATAQDPACV
jgi:hypothetical protein